MSTDTTISKDNEIDDNEIHCFGLDVGGSLGKLVFVERHGPHGEKLKEKGNVQLLDFIKATENYGSTGVRDAHMEANISQLGRVHFIRFATNRIEGAVRLIKEKGLSQGISYVYATGGGAHKYKALFEKELGIKFIQKDELATVVNGMVYLIRNVHDECFSLEPGTDEDGPTKKIYKNLQLDKGLFPFLVCNIGTGVSIVKVDGPNSVTRISGTALGGGTFLGLCRLLTKATEFDAALDMAETGNDQKVNMLVKDIYSSDIKSFNLPGDLTASFFAKNIQIDTSDGAEVRQDVSDNDISRALCIMVAQNVTQIAHLNARLHSVKKVFFTGNFLRHNPIALRTIVHNMDRWTLLDGVKLESLFFRHEGYLGAFGTFLNGCKDIDLDKPYKSPKDNHHNSHTTNNENSSKDSLHSDSYILPRSYSKL